MVQAAHEYSFAVVPKRMNSQYWQTVQKGCQTRARVLTLTTKSNVTCLFTGPAQGGPDTEVNQLAILTDLLALHQNGTRMLHGLALAVVEAPSATEIIQQYTTAGIPVFTFDSDAVDSLRLAYIGTNNYEMGAELGRVLLQVSDSNHKKDQDGDAVLGVTTASMSPPTFGLIGAGSPNIALRMQGVRDILTTAGWTEVTTSPQNCMGNGTLGVEQMQALVQSHPDLTAIVPVGDWPMMDSASWMNFVDANRHLFLVVGDSLQDQIDLMNMGYANALVGQLPFEMGKFAIDNLLLVNQRREQGLPPLFYPGQEETIETSFLNVINIPRDLPPLVQDMNYIGQWKTFGYTLAGIVMALSIVFALWTFSNKHTRVVKASQPFFLLMICAGCFIMSSAIIPLSVDDQHASQRWCDIACMAAPWTFSIGFVVAFSALFSKTWRVNKVFRSPHAFRRIKVTETDVTAPFGVLFIANVIVLICWTVISPLRFERLPHSGTDNWNRVYKSFYGTCTSSSNEDEGYHGSAINGVLLIIINLIALVTAAFQGYQARHIHVEFSESQYIAFAIVCMLEAFLVGTPILILMAENPVATFMVQSILIFFSSAAVLLFIFVPKIVRANDVRNSRLTLSFDHRPPYPQLESPPEANEKRTDESTTRNATESDEAGQLKFRVVQVGLPVTSSIKSSISLHGNNERERGRSTADVPLDGTDVVDPKAKEQNIVASRGIYKISEVSSSSNQTTSERSRHALSAAKEHLSADGRVSNEENSGAPTNVSSLDLDP